MLLHKLTVVQESKNDDSFLKLLNICKLDKPDKLELDDVILKNTIKLKICRFYTLV